VTPILLRACKDPIPNVKFCAAKAIKDIQGKDKFDEASKGQIKEVLIAN
jgi:hypothetical protein